MSVLTAVQAAATSLAIDPVPGAVFGATSRAMVEMKVVVNEAAREIADAHDWSVLQGIGSVTGDGTTVDFDLPADFDRMSVDAMLWSSTNTLCPLERVQTLNDWIALDLQGFTAAVGQWITYGGQLHIREARASGETVKFPYVSTNVAANNSGSPKASFTADTDTFRLGANQADRLLTLGIIWLWKSKKGIDYAEEMSTFQDALGYAIAKDRPARIFAVGRQRTPANAVIAYPKALG
jgi:hypothetical protein